jgi:hypothetical protein
MSDDATGLQLQIDSITERYKPEIEQLTAEGQAMQDQMQEPGLVGCVIGVDFDVNWQDVEMIFDIPQFAMREKRIGLDLPVIVADRQRIVFHTPSVRMVPKVIGKYPEFHGTTIKWKKLITHMPEPFMEKQEIIFDLPSVRMERKDIVLDLPEVTMDRVRWVVRLPEVIVRNVQAQTSALKDKGEALKQKGEALAARMRAEIDVLVAAFTAPLEQKALEARRDVAEAYDAVLQEVSGKTSDLQRRGIDPIKVPADAGTVNLRKVAADVVNQRDTALKALDAALEPILGAADDPSPALAEAA